MTPELGQKAVLKFEAEWCAPCKALEPVLQQIEEEHSFEIERINIESEQALELVQQLRIQSVPTLVVLDEEGIEVARMTGTHARSRIEAFLYEHTGFLDNTLAPF